MEEEKIWEELVRSKLYDFEVDTDPKEWDALSEKLGGGKIVRFSFYRKLTFTASAAAVIALLIVGGIYLFSERDSVSDPLAVVEKSFQQDSGKDAEAAENVTVPDEIPVDNIVEKTVEELLAFTGKQEKKDVVTLPETKEEPPVTLELSLVDDSEQMQKPDIALAAQPEEDRVPEMYLSEQPHLAAIAPETKRRRWSFGVGGGGYAISSTTGGISVTPTSGVLGEEEYMHDGNTITLRNGTQTATLFDPIDGLDNNGWLGKVKHQLPISAGLGVGYHLTDRWSLQSGIVYTLLRSKGKYMDAAGNVGERKQNLHFIGIPLSASFKIAEWKRINFYAMAGGMGEWNFAGKQKEIIIVENLETIESESLRMKELLWSVHTRAGAVYPVWKFVNIYAETGVSYYFDNKSAIKTVRSDKPFNISLQAGIRLGF